MSRLSYPLIILPILSGLVFVSCVKFPEHSSSEYIDSFLHQLANEQFQDLYDNSAPDIKGRCSRESFVAQLTDLTNEARLINPDLQWQKNFDLIESEGVKRLDKSNLIFAHREVRNDKNDWLILSVYWTDEYGPVQLSAVSLALSVNGETRPKGSLCAGGETLPIR